MLACPPAAELCSHEEAPWPRLYNSTPGRGPAAGGVQLVLAGAHFDSLSLPLELSFGLDDGTDLVGLDLSILDDRSATVVLPPMPGLTSRACSKSSSSTPRLTAIPTRAGA